VSLAELLESIGSGAGGSRLPAVLLLLLPLSFVFRSFLCFFFFFFFSFGLLPLFFSLFFSSFSFSPLFSCFYRQKNKGERPGWCSVLPPLHRPSNTWKVFLGKWGWSASFWEGVDVFLKREMAVTEEEKIFFFPYLARRREEEDPRCRQNSTVLIPFFFREQCMKRRRFRQNVSFHLKGKGGKNVSEFTLVLNLWFVQSNPKLQFWFKNQCNCIPAKNQTTALKLAASFTLVLGLEFMQFNHQLSNKLLISSIWPLFWFNCNPSIYACFSFWSLVSDFFN